MARNEEKAKNMMNRWTTFKQELRVGKKDRRPNLATECDSVSEAERHRRTLLGEISEKMSMIQNAGYVAQSRASAGPLALSRLPRRLCLEGLPAQRRELTPHTPLALSWHVLALCRARAA